MSERVKESMTREIVYVGPDEPLSVAYEIMRSHRFRHLPVIHEGRLKGVLSDRDVLLVSQPKASGGVEVPQVPVSEAMSIHPVTCREDSTVSQVASVMIERKIDSLPVLDGKSRVVGMVTSTDLMLLLLDDASDKRDRVIPFNFQMRPLNEFASVAVN